MIATATYRATPVCVRSARPCVALDKALIVARYGGEEFALLLPGLDIEHAVALAEEARRSIEELLMTHADSPCGIVTISIGVESRVPEPGYFVGLFASPAKVVNLMAPSDQKRGRQRSSGRA